MCGKTSCVNSYCKKNPKSLILCLTYTEIHSNINAYNLFVYTVIFNGTCFKVFDNFMGSVTVFEHNVENVLYLFDNFMGLVTVFKDNVEDDLDLFFSITTMCRY